MVEQTNNERRFDMRSRITKLLVGVSAVSAFAIGGASLAGAATNPAPAPVGPPAATAPESATASESASAPNDGPGGHADDPANSTIDNQFQGQQ
jgi:hypothetical protein